MWLEVDRAVRSPLTDTAASASRAVAKRRLEFRTMTASMTDIDFLGHGVLVNGALA